MGIESVAKRESFQRGKQSEGRCMLNMCDFQLTGGAPVRIIVYKYVVLIAPIKT